MADNPYTIQPRHAYWKNGVEKSDPTFPDRIHSPKWHIGEADKIATMGSCFAQHIAHWLRKHGYNVPCYEIRQNGETGPEEQVDIAFSANYGNIYTVRQALQLFEEALGYRNPSEIAWRKGNFYVDAFRPNAFKRDLVTEDQVAQARVGHLAAVRRMIADFDVFVLTLGLTEAWRIKACGSVVPTAPGVVAGEFDPARYEFVNFKYSDILCDLRAICALLGTAREGKPYKLLLTVSPVPLTATATERHVLLASTYSKSVLRAVAGDFTEEADFADYFPSYEIITNPAARSRFFEANLRSVQASAVEAVMQVFASVVLNQPLREAPALDEGHVCDPDCEDALLEAFAKADPQSSVKLAPADKPGGELSRLDERKGQVGSSWQRAFAGVAQSRLVRKITGGAPVSRDADWVLVGDSHLAGFKERMAPILAGRREPHYFFPVNFGADEWTDFKANDHLTRFVVASKYRGLVESAKIMQPKVLVLVGLGLAGDGIVRAHGTLAAGFDGCDGRSISPSPPIVSGVDDSLIAFYRRAATRIVELARGLETASPYESIYWLASPDMCVATARFRFGAAFVKSGAYIFHKQAYLAALTSAAEDLAKVKFIFHDNTLAADANGFSRNQYRASERLWDIHCNGRYFDGVIELLLAKAGIPR